MSDWGIILVTLVFSALCSGLEIAFISANKLKVEIDKNKGKFTYRYIAKFYETPWKFISALLLGNNISLVIYGIYISKFLNPPLLELIPIKFHSETLFLTLQTIIATMVILFTAEFLPKILFRINANYSLQLFAIPAILIYFLLYPIAYFFITIAEYTICKLFKINLQKQSHVFSPLDIDNYINEFTNDKNQENEIKQELQMFQNAIDFRDIKLRECMVPRTEIIAIDCKSEMSELLKIFIDTNLSKILVFDNSIDNIIGYVHSHDMLKNPQSIKQILKPIIIVPETMLANKLLPVFIEQQKSIAVVVDEFGGTSGMLTLEDVIEEIFGEIDDEFDIDELTEKTISDYEFEFSGRLEIDYLNETYKLDIPVNDEYETLAGFIIHNYENIPKPGEIIQIDQFNFTIIEATKTKILKVRLKLN